MQFRSPNPQDPKSLPSWLARYGVFVAATIAAGIGGLWLVLWICGLPQLWTEDPVITMKANLALGLVLAASALLLVSGETQKPWRRWTGAAAAMVVFLIGALTFVEHVFRYDLGIDQLLFTEPLGAAGVVSPNRMGPPGALGLTLIGFGLLALAFQRRAIAAYAGIVVCAISLFPAIGYIYGVSSIYGAARVTGIAWPSIPALMALGVGLAIVSSEAGPMATVFRRDAGGALLRHMLPAVVIIPIVFGYIRTIGERAGLYDAGTGRALLVISLVVVFSVLMWISAARLSQANAAQASSLAAMRESEAKFRAVFEGAAVGMGRVSFPDGVWVDANDALCEMVGYTREEMRKTPWTAITHPDDVESDLIPFRRMMAGDLDTYTVEKRFLHKQGHSVCARLTLSLVRDANGRPDYEIAVVEDITERKRAEQALRQAEERFRLFMDNSPAIVWIKDAEGRYVYLNRTYQQRFGVRTEDYLGKVDAELWPQEIAARLRENDIAALDSDSPVEVVEEPVGPDGSRYSFLNTKFPLRDEKGNRFVAGIGFDITEKRRVEQTLRQSNERFVKAFSASPDGLVISKASDRTILEANDSFLKMFALRREEAIGHNPAELGLFVNPADRTNAVALPLSEQVSVRDLELSVHTRAGEVQTVLISVESIELGGQHCLLTMIRDITDRKRAEEELRHAAELLDLGDAFLELDSEWRIVRVNASQEKLSRTPRSETIGRVFWDVWPETAKPNSLYWIEYHRCMKERVPVQFDEYYAPLDLWTGVVAYPTSTGIAVFFRDVSDRKRAEQGLIRSEKLASAGRLASSMAHEINNPLAAALNALYLATLDRGLGEGTRRHLELAESELGRVAHLTKQTLGFYRETGAPTKVDLRRVADSVIELFTPRLKNKEIRVERRYSTDAQVFAIEGEVRQILSNLFSNSIDAVRPGGWIRVKIANMRLDEYRPSVRLTVTDNGCGVESEHLSRLFEPFFSTKEKTGTGLGLWVTQELVKKHGGTIRMRSKPGIGTVFEIQLPVERRDEQRIGVEESRATA